MNVVCSSGWLEYFTNAEDTDFFAPPRENANALVVPAISLYEVYEHVLRERGEAAVTRTATYMKHMKHMKQGNVVSLNEALAVQAATTNYALKLPMAGGIILETTRSYTMRRSGRRIPISQT